MAAVFQKPPVMIDANVLILAARTPAKDEKDKVREMIQASKQLVMQLPVVRMSAVSMAEVLRRATPEEHAALAGLGKSFDDIFAEPLTGDMARLAARLVNHRTHPDPLCRRCQNVLAPKTRQPCSECGCISSPYCKLDDALIAATAALTKGVEQLVTADTGVVDLGRLLAVREIAKDWPQARQLKVEFVSFKFGPLFGDEPATPVSAQPNKARAKG